MKTIVQCVTEAIESYCDQYWSNIYCFHNNYTGYMIDFYKTIEPEKRDYNVMFEREIRGAREFFE